MKKYLMGLLTGILIMVGLSVFAEALNIYENPFKILVNGQYKNIQGYNINDKSYFQLRDIALATGNLNIGFENDTIILNSKKAEESEENNNLNNNENKSDLPELAKTSDGLDMRHYGDGIYYVATWDIEEKIKNIGIEDPYNYFFLRNEFWYKLEPVFSNVPLSPDDKSYILASYYEETLLPFINNLLSK